MDLIIALLAIILSLAFYLFTKTFRYWTGLGVVQFPMDFPYGNAKGLTKEYSLSEFMVKYYQKVKSAGVRFGGIYTFVRPSLMIVDLDLVKTILVKDFNVFMNRGVYYNEKDDPVSAHIFNLEGEPWRNLRQKLSPTFTSGKIKMMFGTIDEVAEKLMAAIEKQISQSGQLEVKDTLARFTTDVIGNIAFGIDCNSLEDEKSKFYEMGTRIFSTPSSTLARVLRSTYKDLARKLHIKSLSTDLAEFYLGITREAVEYREKNPQINRQDFINLLVQMKKQNLVTVEQIAAQSFIFFLAGYETSSSTMTYCMYELSINEDVQEKARKCVCEAIEKHGGELSYDTVSDMEYLERCIDETLRKYPVVSNLVRNTNRKYEIPDSDVVLPANQSVWIPVHAIHHDPEIYPEPERFLPERFAPEEVAKRHQFAYLPFGEGPRICIGMRFAIVEMKLTLAKLLLKYRFSLDRTKTMVPLKINVSSIVLSPAEKIYLNMERI